MPDQVPGKQTRDYIFMKLYEKYRLPDKTWEAKDFCDKNSDKIEYTLYQQFLKEYVKTKKDGMLLYHAMGSGKTISSILMAKELYKTGKYKRINVLLPASIKPSFIKEIKKISSTLPIDLYSYNTAKLIDNLPVSAINDSITIIDEIHNLVSMMVNNSKIGNKIYRTFDKSKNCFVIGLSGTPIINDQYELSILFNIIKPKSFLLEGDLKYTAGEIYDRIKNMVSYYEGPTKESDIFPRKIEHVVKLKMSRHQENYFSIMAKKEEKAEEKKIKQRKKKLVEKNIIDGRHAKKIPDSFLSKTRQACNMSDPGTSDEELSRNLRKYSVKFDEILKTIQKTDGKVLVYSNFVTSTINILKKVFKMNNIKYIDYIGGKTDAERKTMIEKFNRKNDIQVILASKCGCEGINLLNVRQVHVVEPHWNNARIDQVIARAIRLCSHNSLSPADRVVDIYKYYAISSKFVTSDIKIKEIANKKSNAISRYDNILKKSAVDCKLNFHQNKSVTSCF